MILLYISSTYFSIYYISHTWYLYTNALYIKFLNSFFVPDVLSATLLVSDAASVVFSSSVMVGGLVFLLSTSECQVGFSSGVLDNLFVISTGNSDISWSISLVFWDDSCTEILDVTFLWYCTEILLYMF